MRGALIGWLIGLLVAIAINLSAVLVFHITNLPLIFFGSFILAYGLTNLGIFIGVLLDKGHS